MSLTIFERKPTVVINGETIIDLTYPSIRYNYDPYVEGYVAITDATAMRPDLASKAAYGSTEFWDLLLKYNSISNPFSLNSGDILLIPSMSDMTEQLSPSGVQDNIGDTVRQQYIDLSKAAQADPNVASTEQKRRAAQRAKGLPFNQPTQNLPPNIAQIGDREIIIQGGKVFFGPDISGNKAQCEVPLSKSEFIARLIKNRINT